MKLIVQKELMLLISSKPNCLSCTDILLITSVKLDVLILVRFYIFYRKIIYSGKYDIITLFIAIHFLQETEAILVHIRHINSKLKSSAKFLTGFILFTALTFGTAFLGFSAVNCAFGQETQD